MTGFDRLERELERAAAARRRRAPSWWRGAAGAGTAVAVTAALASVAVIAVGAVVLLHGRRGAASAAEPAPAAQSAAWARALSCRLHMPLAGVLAKPVVTDAAPSPRLLALLSALRGPWTPADAAPADAGRGTAATMALVCVARTLDVAYVRYVGPGPGGSRLYLVPGTVGLPRLTGWTPYRPAPRLTYEPMVCLIAVGGASAEPAGCAPPRVIERPLAFGVAGEPQPRSSPLPLFIVRQMCAHVPGAGHLSATARARLVARCTANLRHARSVTPATRQVTWGIVRDGIATVDVYTQTGRTLLAVVPVHDNVYAFELGKGATGLVKLVFKNANGRVVPSASSLFGTGPTLAARIQAQSATATTAAAP